MRSRLFVGHLGFCLNGLLATVFIGLLPPASAVAGDDAPIDIRDGKFSPETLRRLTEWQKKIASLDDGTKLAFQQQVEATQEVVSSLQPAQVDEIFRFMISGGKLPDEPRFHLLQSAFIDFLVEHGQRKKLIELLAVECPTQIFLASIEYVLVSGGEHKLDDPLLVLCDAFDRSTDEKNGNEIAKILASAVPEFATTKPPSQRVRSIRDWYALNEGNLTPNQDYDRNRFEKNNHLFEVKEPISGAKEGAARASDLKMLVSEIKPGTTERAASELIQSFRGGSESLWDDASRGNECERFPVGKGRYILLKFDSTADPFNIRVSDKVSSVQVVNFDDLKADFPAELFPAIRVIHRSPSLNGHYFDPEALIQCVNALFDLGNDKAILALEAYEAFTKKAEDAEFGDKDKNLRFDYDLNEDRLFPIIRLLFVPMNPGDKLPDMGWMLLDHEQAGEAIAKQFPFFPLVVEDDIPFNLSRGYVSGGAVGKSLHDYLRFCRSHGKLRSSKLVPKASPLKAVERILDSDPWKRTFPPQDPKSFPFAMRLMQVQALRICDGSKAPAFLDATATVNTLADLWEAEVRDPKFENCRWDSNRQIFLVNER